METDKVYFEGLDRRHYLYSGQGGMQNIPAHEYTLYAIDKDGKLVGVKVNQATQNEVLKRTGGTYRKNSYAPGLISIERVNK